jgi:DNA-binding transcriptional regulator GbsR (MarR family)
MSDKLPKVSIAVVGVVIAQIGGFIWWTAQQASTIANLEETVSVLTVENNATDRTNLIRDVEENSENIDEIVDILAEIYEDLEDKEDDIYEEIEVVWDDVEGMLEHMNHIIKLQARVKTLENTLEYLTRSHVHSDAR